MLKSYNNLTERYICKRFIHSKKTHLQEVQVVYAFIFCLGSDADPDALSKAARNTKGAACSEPYSLKLTY